MIDYEFRPEFFENLFTQACNDRVRASKITGESLKSGISQNMKQELLKYPTAIQGKMSLRMARVFKTEKI